MFGEIGAWPYKGLGGIFPDEQQPGFKHIILRPNFVSGLKEFEARHNSPYGEIVSSWKHEGKKVVYDVTIQQNTTATLYIPQGMKDSGTRELGPGNHQIIIK